MSSLVPVALLFGGVLHLATAWGAGHRELLAAGLVVVCTQLVPGVVIWRSVRPRTGWWVEDVALGLAVGAALAVPSQVAAVSTSTPWLAAVLPPLVAAVVLAVPSSRSRVRSAPCRPLPWLWGLCVAASCALPLVNAARGFREPVRWTGWATPYVDFPYHLALSGELAHRFPPHYPQVAGERLYYHWFSHAWVAQVSNLSGAPLDVVLMRFMPVLLAVAVPLATAVVAMRIARSVWAGPLAAVIAFAVVEFDVWALGRASTPIAGPLSPTQGFGLLVLMPTVGLLVLRWRGEAARGAYALLLPLLVVVGGSKGSVLPILVAGALLASAVAVLHRTPRSRRIVVDTVTATLVMLVLLKFLFAGGVSGTRLAFFEPLVKARGEEILGSHQGVTGLAMLSFLVLALLPTYLGAVAGLRILLGSDTRKDPVAWMLAGGALAGAGAIMALDHSGFGQYYFLRTSEVPLSMLAAWGLVAMLVTVRRPVAVAAAGAAAGTAGVLVAQRWPGPLEASDTRHLTAWAAVAVFLCVAAAGALVAASAIRHDVRGGGRRTGVAVLVAALSSAGLVPMVVDAAGEMPSAQFGVEHRPGAVHSTEARAARWIRDHSRPDDVVMTNQHCRKGRGPDCDHRRFHVAAYSERGVLVEGWAYTKTANALGAENGVSAYRLEFWDQDLLRLNDRFLLEPTATDAARLYDLGVRWVYMDEDIPHARSLAPFAVERFHARSVRVYELLDPAR